MKVPAIVYDIDENTFPEGKALIEEVKNAAKAQTEKLAALESLLKKSDVNSFLKGLIHPGRYNGGYRLHVNSYGKITIHISPDDIQKDWIETPVTGIDATRLDARTVNLLLSSKLLTADEKREMLGLKPLIKDGKKNLDLTEQDLPF